MTIQSFRGHFLLLFLTCLFSVPLTIFSPFVIRPVKSQHRLFETVCCIWLNGLNEASMQVIWIWMMIFNVTQGVTHIIRGSPYCWSVAIPGPLDNTITAIHFKNWLTSGFFLKHFSNQDEALHSCLALSRGCYAEFFHVQLSDRLMAIMVLD